MNICDKVNIFHKLFDCERLIDNDNYSLLKYRFKAIHGAKGITKYFRKQSIIDDENNYCRNYVIKFKGTQQIAACFSLKAGSIPYSKNVPKLEITKDSKLIPAIELVNIAINDLFQTQLRKLNIKIGQSLYYNVIESIVKEISEKVGVQVIYLFAANPKLSNYYKSWGFNQIANSEYNNKIALECQNSYNKNCIFMYKPTKEIQINY